MKKYLITILLCAGLYAKGQELFVFKYPASNAPAKSISAMVTSTYMDDLPYNINIHFMPEVMIGISKKLMVNAGAFISDKEGGGFETEGGMLYAKYRFYSKDEVHAHFRMAAFGQYSFNNSPVHQPAIDLYGHNSGYETGIVATQLKNKVAVSGTVSYLYANDNSRYKFFYGDRNRKAIGYSLSVGRLMLPKEYVNYKQTNLNLMVEFLGQTVPNSRLSYLDIAPSVQLIFNSRTRIEAAYRFTVNNRLSRNTPEGLLLRFQYTFFNAFK